MRDDLPKFPLPLIIIGSSFRSYLLGVGGYIGFVLRARKGKEMRIRVFKRDDGKMDVFVEPSPGKGKNPVFLERVTPENVAEEVLPVIIEMRRPKQQAQAPTGRQAD